MHWMKWLPGSVVVALVAFGCSGSDGSGGAAGGSAGSGAGGSGGAGQSQNGWWCSCGGTVSYGLPKDDTQQQAEQDCTDQCAANGGAPSVTPRLTLVGTKECTEYCKKADALGCPGSTCAEQADFWCEVGAQQCPEQLLAQLACDTEKGVFECDANSWKMTAQGCGTFSDLCP
jgi:hypothetical protein